MPSQPSPKEGKSPRQKYRSSLLKRQVTIYGFLVLVLAGVLAVAFMGLTGRVNVPFASEFSKKPNFVDIGEQPCPVDATSAVTPEGVKIQVLNASSIPSGADTLSKRFAEQGYEIGIVDNASKPYKGEFLIETGADAVDRAYTVAQYFGDGARVRFVDVPGLLITITIGENAEELPSTAKMTEITEAHGAIKMPEDCKEVNPASIKIPAGKPAGSPGEQSGAGADEDQSS
jgi:hypothetical protein